MSNAQWLVVLGLPIVMSSCGGEESGAGPSSQAEAGITDTTTDQDAERTDADASEADTADDAPDGPATCQGLDTSTAKPVTGCAWSGYRGAPTYINGTSDTDIWVTSEGGPVMHYDGQVWKTYELGHQSYADPMVLGTDALLLGLGSALGYFDGTTWNTLDMGVEGSASRLWGSGPCNLWASGDQDYWLHNDGSGWRKIDDPLDWGHDWMWGTASDDMFLIGSELVPHLGVPVPAGRIGHWNGTEWMEMWREEYRDIKGIWGTASEDVFAVGGLDPLESLVLHFDGETWTEMPLFGESGGA